MKTYTAGIVGLPNVGKSTLFNFLTNSEQAKSENYPFCTIDPNVAIVNFHDFRIDELAKVYSSKKKIYSHMEIVDIAGLVKGASQGDGLGNQFLAHIRETDIIIHVVRCFENSDIIHVEDHIDPIADLEVVITELRLADKETIEKMQKKFSKDPEMLQKLAAAETAINSESLDIPKDLPLLSSKPFIVLGNGEENQYVENMKNYCQKHNITFINFDFNNKNSKNIDMVLEHVFKFLHVIFYFTCGPQETRSWPIPDNINAKLAAAAIHTDISDKFIKAEVFNFKELHTKYRVRQEGKEYIVQDGDIIIFKHNG